MHCHLCFRGWWFYQWTLIHFQTLRYPSRPWSFVFGNHCVWGWTVYYKPGHRGHVRRGSGVPLMVGLCLTWSHMWSCQVRPLQAFQRIMPSTSFCVLLSTFFPSFVSCMHSCWQLVYSSSNSPGSFPAWELTCCTVGWRDGSTGRC